jgi:hypothetical protein
MTKNASYLALGALNDAINALNLALGRAADLDIPLELWAKSVAGEEQSARRWHVYLGK